MKDWFEVQTWDEQHNCVRYHSVVDAIDYEDAQQVIAHMHPEQKLLAVVKKQQS